MDRPTLASRLIIREVNFKVDVELIMRASNSMVAGATVPVLQSGGREVEIERAWDGVHLLGKIHPIWHV